MAAGKSTYLENKVLDMVLGANTSFTTPATVYIGLYTTTPSAGGTGGVEVAGNGYARVAVTNTSANWTAASSGAKTNVNLVQFPQATPSGWGTITGAGIFDASSAGNLLYWSDLQATKAVSALDIFDFVQSALSLSES